MRCLPSHPTIRQGLGIGLLLLSVGCADHSVKPSGQVGAVPDERSAAGAGPQTNAPATSDVTAMPQLEYANWDEMQEKIAKQRGKVVVIDLWATS